MSITLGRTWRWHHLLRGGGDGRLDPEQQKGLIGELLVFERLLLPELGPSDAVASWHGPVGAPKDFEVGRLCIEAKARRGAATPYVAISSEHQLDVSGVDLLFLHVAELDQELAPEKAGQTLTQIAERCRGAIADRDRSALEPFEELLEATGFRWEDDYSDFRWVEGHHQLFRVGDHFPALSASSCPVGVSYVRYSLSLIACQPHRCGVADLQRALRGNGNAD